MKKKIVVWLTAAACVFALTACGAEGNTAAGSASSAGSQAVSEASEAVSAVSETSSASSEASSEAVSASSAEETSSVSSETSALSEAAEEELVYTEEEEALLAIPVVDKELAVSDCVELCDYSNVEVKDAYVAPTDDDMQQFINSLIVPVAVEDENAVVGDGDTANIDYVGKIDGEAFEGGTGNSYDLVIGSGTFIDGFEDGVIGMKAGEVKEISVRFPDDYWNEDMAAKDAVFTVTLNSIKHTPEYNDEWVAKYSKTEETTVEGFEAYVKKLMEENARQMALENEEMEMLQYIVDNSTIKQIPKSYVDEAEENFDAANQAQAEEYGMDLTELLEVAGLTQEYYDHEKAIAARESAKNTLIYDAIWEQEKLTDESEEFQDALKALEETYMMSVEELEEQYGEDTIHNYGKAYALLQRIITYAKIVPADTASETSASSAG